MDNIGIEMYNSPSSIIADNHIKNNGAVGLTISQAGPNMKVLNNQLYNNYDGIRLTLNTQALVKGNTVDQHNNTGRGILVDQCTPTIDGNHIMNTNVGIQFYSIAGGKAINNKIEYGDGSSDVGIKVQQQSSPQIINNTIYKFWTGMTVYGLSDPIVEKNTISKSTIDGIYFQAGKGTFRNNTIRDNNNDGVDVILGSDSKFYDNSIHDNQRDAMHIDSSNIVAINNNLSMNIWDGIHLTKTSTADIRDNTFLSNGFGVGLDDTARASLKNNNFNNNIGGAVVGKTTNHVDWTVDKTILAKGNDFTMPGNLTIKQTGNLELRGLFFKFYSTASQKYWLDAKGPLFLNGSSMQAQDPAQPYALRAAGGLKVVDGAIANAGYNFAGLGENAGVYVNGSTGYFLNSDISACYDGLVANGATVTMEKGTISNNIMDGVRVEGGASVIISNSSMIGNVNKDLVLDGASTIDMRNASFNKNAVTFNDATSKLHVSWFVGVNVAWPNDQGGQGNPVDGASVKVVDALTTTVATRTTDATGTIGAKLVLKEYTKTLGSQTNYSPYNISASINPVVAGHNNTAIDKTKDVLVLLGDLTPPTINISTPKDNEVYNHLTVAIKGTASDTESGIKVVMYSIDGGLSWKSVNGTTTWNATMFLAQGTYPTIIARAWNQAGGYSTATVKNIYVDNTPPYITWISPANNTLINKKLVNVSGTTKPLAHVTINTLQTNASAGGAFGVDLPLVEGPNTITITAEDRAHNTRSSWRSITVDTIAPFIIIDGAKTRTVKTPQMDITGSTEPGAHVTVNNGAVNVDPTTGKFAYSVTLSDGPNVYTFDATDKAANKNSTSVTIILKMRAPSLTVLAPTDGATLKDRTVKAQAMTDVNPDGTIKGYINGVQATVDANGAFSADVSLTEGVNQITFKVMDDALNNQSKYVRVTVDTVVPTISVTEPKSGTTVNNDKTTIYIVGKTEPGATINANNKTAQAGTTGDFSLEVPLAVGPNQITITVTDKAGNKATQTITVTRKPTNGGCTGSNCPCTGSNCGNGNGTKPTDWSTYLPIIIILIVIVAIVGAAAAFAGRKGPPVPPAGRRRQEEEPYGKEDRYAGDRDYPRAAGKDRYADEQGGYDDQGYDQGQGQEGYDQGYGDGQYQDQGYDQGQEGYDQGYDNQGYDQGHGEEQYQDPGYDKKGKRY
jgi:parallel beta-helix repeat protein